MYHTEFSFLTSDELVSLALAGYKTNLELELAQRLELALDMLSEASNGNDARSSRQSCL